VILSIIVSPRDVCYTNGYCIEGVMEYVDALVENVREPSYGRASSHSALLVCGFAMNDLDQALLDPHAYFRSPEDLLMEPQLPRRQKIELLARWAYDAVELAVAEEEGMGGGESSNLDRVLVALNEITGGFATERAAPTKHAVSAALLYLCT
jgi:hypothetical protein